jgi:hypothetical protein
MKRNLNFIIFDVIILVLWAIFLGGTYGLSLLAYEKGISGAWLVPAILFSGFVVLCAMGIVLPRPAVGKHHRAGLEAFKWYVQFQYSRIWHYQPIYHVVFSIGLLRFIFLRCHGAKVAFSTSISSFADIHDPYCLKFGPGAIIGMHATIVGHFIVGDVIVVGPVEVGEDSLVGAWTVVGPRTKIGDRCIIEAACELYPGAVLADGGHLPKGTQLRKP